jgi:glycosyltransferase involved in cell wall biosynthesis
MQDNQDLRVVHINDVAYVAGNLVSGLQRLGVWAKLIELRHRKDIKTPSFLWAFFFPLVRIAEAFKIKKFVTDQKIDIIHLHYATHVWMPLLLNLKFYLHLHGTDIRRDLTTPVLKQLILKGIERAEGVFYVTPDLESKVRELRKDAIFLPDPVDTGLFMPTPNINEAKTVLCLSKMDPTKGMDKTIQGIELIWKENPDILVKMFGFGASPEIAASFLEKHRSNPNLIILSRMPHFEMVELIQSASIVLGQFQLGALGCSELEAMSCGKPVITNFSYPGAYPEPPPILNASTPEEIAGHALSLLRQPELECRIGEEARLWVQKYHDKKVIARALLNNYRF